MSKTAQGPGWWVAADGNWYPPELHPGSQAATAALTVPAMAGPPPPVAPYPEGAAASSPMPSAKKAVGEPWRPAADASLPAFQLGRAYQVPPKQVFVRTAVAPPLQADAPHEQDPPTALSTTTAG